MVIMQGFMYRANRLNGYVSRHVRLSLMAQCCTIVTGISYDSDTGASPNLDNA